MKLCFWELNLAGVSADGEGQRWGDQLGSREDLHPRRRATGEKRCMNARDISGTKLVEFWRSVE